MIKKILHVIVLLLVSLSVFIHSGEYTRANAEGNITVSYSLSGEVTTSNPTTIYFEIDNGIENLKLDSISFYMVSNYKLTNLSYNLIGNPNTRSYFTYVVQDDLDDGDYYYYEINYFVDVNKSKSSYSSVFIENGKFSSVTFNIDNPSFYHELSLSISELEIKNKSGEVIDESLINSKYAYIDEHINGTTPNDPTNPYNLIDEGLGLCIEKDDDTVIGATNYFDVYFISKGEYYIHSIQFDASFKGTLAEARFVPYARTKDYKYLTYPTSLLINHDSEFDIDYFSVDLSIDLLSLGNNPQYFSSGRIGRIYYRLNNSDINFFLENVRFDCKTGQFEGQVDSSYLTPTVNAINPSNNVSINELKINGDVVLNNNDSYEYTTLDYSKDSARINPYFLKHYGRINSVSINNNAITKTGSKYLIPLGIPGSSVVVNIQIISEDGSTTKDYEVRITRAKSTNNRLKAISLNQEGSSVKPILKDNDNKVVSFNGNINNYKLTISEKVNQIFMTPALDDEYAHIYVYDSEVNDLTQLSFASTLDEINIKVVAQNDDIRIYHFDIFVLNDDTSISSITLVDNNSNNITLNKNGDTYRSTDLNANVSYVILNVVPTSNKATVSYSPSNKYSYSSKLGENGMIYVTVTSESGIEQIYTVNAYRVPLSESLDMTIEVKGEDDGIIYTKNNSSTNEQYVYDIPLSAGRVIITATPKDSNTTIVGAGTYEVPQDEIVITASNLDNETYSIKIVLVSSNKDNDNDITSLKLYFNDGTEFKDMNNKVLTFNKDQVSYSFSVHYSVSLVRIDATTSSPNAKLTGNELKFINVGTNYFKVYATSELGFKGKEYTISFFRESPSSDSTLKSISIDEVLISNFDKDLKYYTIYINRDSQVVDLQAETTSPDAVIQTNLGIKALTIGRNEILIKVVAQDESISEYTLILIRAENKNTISNLVLCHDETNLNLAFNNQTTSYELNVPYAINNVNVDVTYDGEYGLIHNDGLNKLNVGLNDIEVYVTSESNIKGQVYHLLITRNEANSNNYLSSLEVLINNENVISSFYKDINRYSLALGENVTSVYIKATPESELSLVSGTGEVSLTSYSGALETGNVIFLVVSVTSEDNNVKNYYINIARDNVNLNDDNNIYSIIVRGKNGVTYFKDEYNSNVLEYNINLPYFVDSVYVDANSYSQVNGNNFYTLNSDEDKQVEVYAISLSGIKGKTYTLNIHRESTLEATKINNIKINDSSIEGFDSLTTRYDLIVDSNNENINLNVTLNKTNSIYTIVCNGISLSNNEEIVLKEGENHLTITVFADQTTYKIYNLNIFRKFKEGKLSSLSIKNVDLLDLNNEITTFNEDIYEYNAQVEYNVSSVELEYLVKELGFKVVSSSTDSLALGINVIQIKVISQINPTTVTTYKINLERKIKKTSEVAVYKFNIEEISDFNEVFKNSTDKYTLEVGSNISNLNINLEFRTLEGVASPTYEIIGGDNLEFGDNNVTIIVTSSDKTNKAIYNLNVRRKHVSLISPSIDEIPDFSTDYSDLVNFYSYQVDPKTTRLTVHFEKDTEDTRVIISDTKLVAGKNEITIDIYSKDKLVRTINLVVTRAGDKGNYVLEITLISIGAVLVFLTISIILFIIIRDKKFNNLSNTNIIKNGPKTTKKHKKR